LKTNVYFVTFKKELAACLKIKINSILFLDFRLYVSSLITDCLGISRPLNIVKE
jgi:hypothetical protein